MPPGYPSKCARAQMASAKTNSAKSSGVMQTIDKPTVDLEGLRKAIQEEYALVAEEPEHGFHFFVGRPLARLLGYDDAWLDGVPEATIASFAGTGNSVQPGRARAGRASRRFFKWRSTSMNRFVFVQTALLLVALLVSVA